NRATAVWKKIFEPKRWPSLAPSMMNPETPSEYSTIAVPTVVGGVLKLSTIPPMDTSRADTLKEISACPRAMTIIGAHEARTSAATLVGELPCVAMTSSPPGRVWRRERPVAQRNPSWPSYVSGGWGVTTASGAGRRAGAELFEEHDDDHPGDRPV